MFKNIRLASKMQWTNTYIDTPSFGPKLKWFSKSCGAFTYPLKLLGR